MNLTNLIAVGRITAACICFMAAYRLLMADQSGWGWFLFTGVLMGMIFPAPLKRTQDRRTLS